MNPHIFASVLSAAQEAEEWAWRRLFEWLAPQLGGYFRVRGLLDPEDQVGEVFLQLARNLKSFQGDIDQFRSWVFIIAHNRLSNEYRRLSRRPLVLHSDIDEIDDRREASAENEALDALEDRVVRLLGALTPDQRTVIGLRVISGFSLNETARIMGRSVGSVKQLQRRALEAMRGQLIRET